MKIFMGYIKSFMHEFQVVVEAKDEKAAKEAIEKETKKLGLEEYEFVGEVTDKRILNI